MRHHRQTRYGQVACRRLGLARKGSNALAVAFRGAGIWLRSLSSRLPKSFRSKTQPTWGIKSLGPRTHNSWPEPSAALSLARSMASHFYRSKRLIWAAVLARHYTFNVDLARKKNSASPASGPSKFSFSAASATEQTFSAPSRQ